MAKMDSFRIDIRGVYYNVPMEESECGVFDGCVKPEPTNAYDPNAIKIIKQGGKKVGYIPKEKTQYIKVLIEDRQWPCKIVLKPVKDDDGSIFAIEGTCYIKGVDLTKIDLWKYENNINLKYDEPIVNVDIPSNSYNYANGTYLVYIGEKGDHKEFVGYEAAYKMFQQLEREIYRCQDNLRWNTEDKSVPMLHPVQLTMVLKHRWFWQRDLVVLQKNEMLLIELDAWWIETHILGITPARYVVKPDSGLHNSWSWKDLFSSSNGGYSGDWSSGGSSDIGSWWRGKGSSSTHNNSGHSSGGLTSTDKFDWETFEASIDSDEYFDFRW